MIEILKLLPPGSILMLGALLIPLFPKRAQSWMALTLPLISMAHFLGVFPLTTTVEEPLAYQYVTEVMGLKINPIRIDRLSIIFGVIFHIAAFLSGLYALDTEPSETIEKKSRTMEHLSGMVYAGAAIAAVFAGDLITLFVFWELTAISSVFLIWASGTEASLRYGVRYLVIQVASGVT